MALEKGKSVCQVTSFTAIVSDTSNKQRKNKGKQKGSIVVFHCIFEAGIAQKHKTKQGKPTKNTKGGQIQV